MITFALKPCSHSASASSCSSARVHLPPGSHGFHSSFPCRSPCQAHVCQPCPSGLSPPSLPATQLGSGQGCLQTPSLAEKVGEMGPVATGSLPLAPSRHNPASLPLSTWLERDHPPRSHSWCLARFSGRVCIYSKALAWKRK